jgi:hypothetical protein
MRICTNIVAANEPGRLPNQYEIPHFIVFVSLHRHNILQTSSWEGSLVPRCGFASPGYAAWGHVCSAAGPATQVQVYNLRSRQFMTRLQVLSHQICEAFLACLISVRGHLVRYVLYDEWYRTEPHIGLSDIRLKGNQSDIIPGMGANFSSAIRYGQPHRVYSRRTGRGGDPPPPPQSTQSAGPVRFWYFLK